MSYHILIIDDDNGILETLKTWFENDGHCVTAVDCYNSALLEVKKLEYDVIIADNRLNDASGHSGFDFLRYYKKHRPKALAVLISGYPIKPIERDNVDLYYEKPLDWDKIIQDIFGNCDNGSVGSCMTCENQSVIDIFREDIKDLKERYTNMHSGVKEAVTYSRESKDVAEKTYKILAVDDGDRQSLISKVRGNQAKLKYFWALIVAQTTAIIGLAAVLIAK